MELSIVVPVYNVEKYLEECLNSINEIKNIDYELIIVNDGSPDNSQKIIEEFCKKNKRAKCYIKENGGLSSARNYGLERAVGEYVWFVDSDDIIIAKEFQVFFQENKKEMLDIICGNYLTFRDGENLKTNKSEKYIYSAEVISGRKYVEEWGKKSIGTGTVWKKIYRREFLKKNNLFFKEGIYSEDFLFTLLSSIKAEKVKYVDKYFYLYRTSRKGSIMDRDSLEKEMKWGISKKIIIEEILKYEFFKEYKWIKKEMISFYINYARTNCQRDLELEKKLWRIKGIFTYKWKSRLRLLKYKYLYRKIK